MKFQLYIRTDNDVFSDDVPLGGGEIARILREIADKVEKDGCPYHFTTIHDKNGNDVGRYALKSDDYR